MAPAPVAPQQQAARATGLDQRAREPPRSGPARQRAAHTARCHWRLDLARAARSPLERDRRLAAVDFSARGARVYDLALGVVRSRPAGRRLQITRITRIASLRGGQEHL